LFFCDVSGDVLGSSEGEIRDGMIDQKVFFDGLKQFFPIKKEAAMEQLKQIVLEQCMERDEIDSRKVTNIYIYIYICLILLDFVPSCSYLVCFVVQILTDPSTHSANNSPFMVCMRAQYMSELDEFLNKLKEELIMVSRQYFIAQQLERAALDSTLTPYTETLINSSSSHPAILCSSDYRDALIKIDPLKSSSDIDQFILRGTGDQYHLNETQTSVQTFLKRLRRTGLVHFTGHWKALPQIKIGETKISKIFNINYMYNLFLMSFVLVLICFV
jgi:hypothetical protein